MQRRRKRSVTGRSEIILQSNWCSSKPLPPYVWLVYASLPDLQETTPSSQHGTNTAQHTHSLVNMHPPSPLPTASYLDRTVHRSREQPPSGDGQADKTALVSREGLHAAHVLDVPDLHAMGEGCTGKGTTQQTLLTSASLVTEQKTQVSTIQMLFHSQCQHTHTTCTQTHMGM